MTDLQLVWRMANSTALSESLPAEFNSSRLIRDGLLPFCDWPCRVRKRRRLIPGREDLYRKSVRNSSDADNGPEMNDVLAEATADEWHLIDWIRPVDKEDFEEFSHMDKEQNLHKRARSWLVARFVGFGSRERIAEWCATNYDSDSELWFNIKERLLATGWEWTHFGNIFTAGSVSAIRQCDAVFDCAEICRRNHTWGLALVIPEATLPGIPPPDQDIEPVVIFATPRQKPS
jgi:hypothetical protein